MFSHGNHWLPTRHPGGIREVKRKWDTQEASIPQPVRLRSPCSPGHLIFLILCLALLIFFSIFCPSYHFTFPNSTPPFFKFKGFHKPAKAPQSILIISPCPSYVLGIFYLMWSSKLLSNRYYYYLNYVALEIKLNSIQVNCAKSLI